MHVELLHDLAFHLCQLETFRLLFLCFEKVILSQNMLRETTEIAFMRLRLCPSPTIAMLSDVLEVFGLKSRTLPTCIQYIHQIEKMHRVYDRTFLLAWAG